jgi:hypothetical protein
MILAVDTLQIAIGKKDIADTLYAADDWFFPFVDAHGCDIESVVTPAKPDLAGCTVGMTIFRTAGAILQCIPCGHLGSAFPGRVHQRVLF